MAHFADLAILFFWFSLHPGSLSRISKRLGTGVCVYIHDIGSPIGGSLMKHLITCSAWLVLLACFPTLANAALLVASNGSTSNSVLQYDQDTGDFVNVFASGGGLSFPVGLASGADGNL